MIVRNCEWVDEAGGEPEKVPRKRLVTEAMAAASRANGAKSQGPTSESGRAKVKFNAVQSGATCKEIVFLPGEDEDAFWAKVDRTIEQEGAQGELEFEAIKTAMYSRVTKRRAINGHAIAVTEKMAQIVDQYDDGKRTEVRELIPNVAKAPDVTVARLMNSSRGCSFLIREFTSIEQRLMGPHSFEVSQREYCLQLAGHRPDELFTDSVVRSLNRAYLASLHGPGYFTTDMAANAFIYDRPAAITETEFARRMEPFVRDLPTIEQGWTVLKTFVQDRLERLKERKELMGFREQRELNAAIGAAQSPGDRDSEKRDRYVNASDRTFNAAVRTLLALKKERRNHGDESHAPSGKHEIGNPKSETNPTQSPIPEPQVPSPDPECSDVASGLAEMDPQPAVIPADNEQSQNEPQATQVVAQPATNNAVSPAPASTQGPMVRLSEEDVAAIQEHYRQSLARVKLGIDKRAGGELLSPS